MSITSSNVYTSDRPGIPVVGDPIRRACEILENVATDRCLTYRCLAKLFTYPDQALVRSLQTGAFYLQMKRITAWLGDEQIDLLRAMEPLDALPGIHLAALQEDYTRLFEVGVERISLRESSYRWKNSGAITQSGADLRQVLNVLYNSVGVSCETGMEDHIAVELEFLAFLCEQEAQRWSNNSPETARNLRSQQRSFADDHIGCWLPEFFYRLQKKNRHSIYGPTAVISDCWLDLDHGSGYRALIELK